MRLYHWKHSLEIKSVDKSYFTAQRGPMWVFGTSAAMTLSYFAILWRTFILILWWNGLWLHWRVDIEHSSGREIHMVPTNYNCLSRIKHQNVHWFVCDALTNNAFPLAIFIGKQSLILLTLWLSFYLFHQVYFVYGWSNLNSIQMIFPTQIF